MRTPALLSALLLASCAHRGAPAPAGQQPAPPDLPGRFDLPAAFAGAGPCPGCTTRLVLLDPAHFVLEERRDSEAPTFTRGAWRRQGASLFLGDEELPVSILGQESLSRQGNVLDRVAPPQLLAGVLHERPEGLRIDPCGVAPPAPLVDGSAELRTALEELPGRFVSLLASVDLDGTVTAWRLERLAPVDTGCEGVPQGLVARASGNEPFWSLEIDERSVRLERLEQDPVGAPWAPFRWQEGAWTYWAETGAMRLEVELKPGACRDTMAPVAYGHHATVRVDGETLRGCGQLGTAGPLLDGAGE